MAESRGKKSKKGQWQLILGAKESFFALVGIIGLVMMSFAMGTLAGRGDIYRVLHNWGFIGPEAAKAVQPWNPPQAGFPPIPPSVPPAPQNPGATLTTAAPSSPALPLPQQGSIAAPPGASAPATASGKKAKQAVTLRDHKSKEEELKRLKEEVAKKLKFQNSLDTSTFKPAKARDKAPATTLVRVGKYRDKKAAQARVAELKKQGEQVSLKEGKDKQGPYYTVYRRKASGSTQPTSSVAQNKPKTAGTKLKSKRE
jgi:hypothetical protein